jgi:hypothetical protein
MDKKSNQPTPLNDFLVGFGAAVQLMRRAQNLGCFIEVVCLSTSVIDAALRIGIILKHQLAENTEQVHNELLYQSDIDKKITERTIYKRALDKMVINNGQFDQLNRLYSQRNQVVHRFVISERTTQDVLKLSVEYDVLLDSITKTIRGLEEEQLTTGKGMTRVGPNHPIEAIRSFSAPKHGSSTLAIALRQSESSVKNLSEPAW